RPAIHPFVGGIVGIKRRVRRERDHRRVLAAPPRRGGQVPGAVVLDELGRPEVVDAGDGVVDPRRLLVPDLAFVPPRLPVLRGTDLHVAVGDRAVAGRVHVPGVAVLGQGRVVRPEVARELPGAGRGAAGEHEHHGCSGDRDARFGDPGGGGGGGGRRAPRA